MNLTSHREVRLWSNRSVRPLHEPARWRQASEPASYCGILAALGFDPSSEELAAKMPRSLARIDARRHGAWAGGTGVSPVRIETHGRDAHATPKVKL